MTKQFVRLPVLDRVAGLSPSAKPFADIVLVGVQHLLETTGSLLEKLIDLGLNPANAFLTGKIYSTSATVAGRLQQMGIQVFAATRPDSWGVLEEQITGDVQRMWRAVQARLDDRGSRRIEPRAILVLDDGAFTVRNLPEAIAREHTVVAVEQTTFGARDKIREGHVHVPVIDVAKSAAKRLLEPVLIRQAVIERLRRAVNLDDPEIRFGIVGLGHIGTAVSRYLAGQGRSASVFDIDDYAHRRSALPERDWCTSLEEVACRSDCILGCTGEDIFADARSLERCAGDKLLASCSSHDIEFRSLLRRIDGRCRNPLNDAYVDLPHGRFRILRGGTPVNFDNSTESVPAAEIALTRGLLLCGLLQALQWIGRPKFQSLESVSLVAGGQRVTVQEWLQTTEHRSLYPPDLLRLFRSDSEIAKLSGGTPDACFAGARKDRSDQKFAFA